MIEPGNWDYGQYEDDPEFNDDIPGSLSPSSRSDRRTRPPGGKIARLRIWNDRLVIAAPDFIHRQITGYPRPVAPPLLSDAERQERSQRASSEGARVDVLSATREANR